MCGTCGGQSSKSYFGGQGSRQNFARFSTEPCGGFVVIEYVGNALPPRSTIGGRGIAPSGSSYVYGVDVRTNNVCTTDVAWLTGILEGGQSVFVSQASEPAEPEQPAELVQPAPAPFAKKKGRK